ncbi:MAG TPA: class F sortase [Actinomycetota bacterium]|nr:class F sortase [Actinomycetota bacterium]
MDEEQDEQHPVAPESSSDFVQYDEDDYYDDEPRLLSRSVKASLIPAIAVLLLFGLPARVAQGPFRGVDVQSQTEADKKVKRAAKLACTKNPDGLPKGAPCRITIRSIGVDAPVIKLGLRSDGTLQVPLVYSEAGWWKGGAKPGQIGSSVIVGHVDNRRGPAVFYKLPKLKSGDIVTISRVDKKPVRYVIEDLGVWAKSNFPSEIVYGPTPISELRLITCGGVFNRSTGHYTDNIIAFGRMIGRGGSDF